MSLRSLFLVVLLTPSLLAQAPTRSHNITVDDYFTIDIILQQQIAPDGNHVAYTVTRWDKASDSRRVDLWCVNCARQKSRRLTFDHAGVASLRWSSDSKVIYFLARGKREGEKHPPLDGSTQVWRVGIEGGEPFAVTRVAGGIQAFELSGGGAVYYQTSAEKMKGEFTALKKEFKGIEYGHGVGKTSQLWKLDLDTWKAEKTLDEGRVIREFKVSADDKAIAMITTPDETVVSFEGKSRVDVFDLETKKTSTLPDKCFRADAASPYGWLENLAFGQARVLAFNIAFDGYPAEIVIAWKGEQGWETSLMKRPAGVHVKGYGSPLAWRRTFTPKLDVSEYSLYYLGEAKGRVHLHVASFHSSNPTIRQDVAFPTDGVVESFSIARETSQLALLMNGVSGTPDLHLLDRDEKKNTVRLTNINPQLDTWKLPQISVVSWKSKDGTPVEGILELPPDHKKGEKVPLVVCIHGGPTTADYLHLQFWIYGRTLLPAKGYALLCPNYRGSTGYGDKFLTDLVGRENDLDVADILSGVDALVEKGIADPEKLGVMGWSNGGYLTNCLITKTTRFKAASSGAGIVDTVMEWGANDEPAYAIVFKKGFPWNQADLYKRTSPTYALDKVRTPTLIHVGGGDERCPPAQSRMLYRALKEYVKVPTELLVYPGEPHGLTKYSNRKAKMEWDLAWFERHLLGKK